MVLIYIYSIPHTVTQYTVSPEHTIIGKVRTVADLVAMQLYCKCVIAETVVDFVLHATKLRALRQFPRCSVCEVDNEQFIYFQFTTCIIHIHIT